MTCLPSAMNSPRLCLGKILGMALRDSGDDDDGNNESYGVVAIYSIDKHLMEHLLCTRDTSNLRAYTEGKLHKAHILMRKNRNHK